MKKDAAETKVKSPRFSTQQMERMLLWILPIFIVVAVAFVVLLFWQPFSFYVPPVKPPHGEETTTAPNPDDGGDPDPFVPVFSGGLLPTPPTANSDTAVLESEIFSKYAILIDADTGAILAGKDYDVKFSPASMTKVMTLIVACEGLTAEQLQTRVMIPNELNAYVTTGAYRGTDNACFEAYERVKLVDLLYGISMKSYSDCAVMVASAVCPADTLAESERLFVERMNQKVAQMGLQNTHFDNVVGHESDENYSTAADIAQIMAYALQSDLICLLLSEQSRETYIGYVNKEGKDDEYRFTYYSTLFNSNPSTRNRMKAYEDKYKVTFSLRQGIRFCGGKTGTLGEASTGFVYSLASFVTVGDKTYIAVTGDTTLNYGVMKDAKTLYDNYIP